jgi:hypothetical protein
VCVLCENVNIDVLDSKDRAQLYCELRNMQMRWPRSRQGSTQSPTLSPLPLSPTLLSGPSLSALAALPAASPLARLNIDPHAPTPIGRDAAALSHTARGLDQIISPATSSPYLIPPLSQHTPTPAARTRSQRGSRDTPSPLVPSSFLGSSLAGPMLRTLGSQPSLSGSSSVRRTRRASVDLSGPTPSHRQPHRHHQQQQQQQQQHHHQQQQQHQQQQVRGDVSPDPLAVEVPSLLNATRPSIDAYDRPAMPSGLTQTLASHAFTPSPAQARAALAGAARPLALSPALLAQQHSPATRAPMFADKAAAAERPEEMKHVQSSTTAHAAMAMVTDTTPDVTRKKLALSAAQRKRLHRL